jgi:hypothetical protein
LFLKKLISYLDFMVAFACGALDVLFLKPVPLYCWNWLALVLGNRGFPLPVLAVDGRDGGAPANTVDIKYISNKIDVALQAFIMYSSLFFTKRHYFLQSIYFLIFFCLFLFFSTEEKCHFVCCAIYFSFSIHFLLIFLNFFFQKFTWKR